MRSFKPVKQSRVSDEVADQLKRSILLGYFKAGDKLPSERDLAEQFRVSRIAIRESLRALENKGFIETRQGVTGGTFVTELTFEHLSNAFVDLFMAEKLSIPELVQMRVLLEPEIARLATLHKDAESAARLKDALEQETLPIRSFAEDFDIKTIVHHILAEMCGNHFFEALERSLMVLTRQAIQAVEPETPFIHTAGMHDEVVEAVLAGDPDRAWNAMRKHAMEFGERLNNMEKNFRTKKEGMRAGL
ncbi:MAG TPA: FadR/GntR family transcriptional regulator [Syntrophorhabdaceae bacterium]|nr:FadR/GntR family transcriptional regulator [Syntrophorhabdaceae bacterium]HQM81612.1 FadR/GntR family transcriptional regulator [Syntrophorhabdaceae bacterium]